MTNIWGFLIQTLEVSAAAGFLLILKELLSDKLSPRWQYGIWSVLLLKAVLPAGIFGYFLSFQLASLVQALKTMTELSLDVDGIFPHSARGISAAGIAPCKTLTAEGETGTAAVDFWTVHLIGMRSDQSRNNEQVGIIGATSGIDMKALPDAVFLDISGYAYRVRYQAGPETNLQKGDGVGMDSVLLTNGDEDIQALFHKLKQEPYSEELWHQTLQTMQGSRRIQDNNFVPSLSLPKGFAVRIYKENEPYYGTGSLVEEISTVSAKGGTAK